MLLILIVGFFVPVSTTLRPISLFPTAPAPAARLALVIRWDISPTALLASPGAAILNGQAAKLRSVALICRVDDSTSCAELTLNLITGESHTITLSENRRIQRATIGDIEHIEAPGLLTLALHDDRILYARTPLLTQVLALPGGTYDVPAIAAG